MLAPTPLSAPRILVRLAAAPATKEAAIREAAQLLTASGCIDGAYGDSMLRREAVANTFLGHGVVIPHGMVDDRHLVRHSGLAVLQVPDGVLWHDGQVAHLVVAIAAQSDTHITVLRRLTRLIQDEARLEHLRTTTAEADIVGALSEDTATGAASGPVTDLRQRFDWTVDYPSGLHARPAAHWVEVAKTCAARIQVRHGAQVADAKSLIGLLQLGLRCGEAVTISAEGDDEAGALARICAAVTGLSAGEKAAAQRAAEAAAKAAGPVAGWNPADRPTTLAGIGASPGLSIGPIHVLASADLVVPDAPEPLTTGADRLHHALGATADQLKALADDTERRLGKADAGIFRAQAELIADTDLITLACQLMVEGHGVAYAWHAAVDRLAGQLAALGNPVLAGRAADLRDVGRRVLAQIDPALRSGHALPDAPCILVASDLAPSDTAGLDPARVIGLATAQGGPTSHTAILARTLGIPALVAGGPGLLALAEGTPAILDGGTGRLYLDPSAADIAAAEAWRARQRRQAEDEARQRALPARTRDGHAVAVGANVNNPEQVPFALDQGAEGVGLMRTEFLFLERGDTPSEDDQYETYAGMLKALDGRPLIVRTLDIGGDKQVSHLQLPKEENPFLGVRGARLLLRRPDLLEPQLRALYRAAKDHVGPDAPTGQHAPLSIMMPMITSVPEVLRLRDIAERIRVAIGAPYVPLGIMIEVPAAAIQADALARHCDFFSIGTNDLTQYALAIDRQNTELAPEADSLHPAVLRLIHMTCAGAARHKRFVGVCGGIAGDPFGACLLAGLGVHELSMTPRDLPGVKARLRGADMAALRALASQACEQEDAAAVRALDTASDLAGLAGVAA
ncbi:phosphoenolpyruvate--protein phosphotransferase [Methylobacterium mesophilicum SR1.6/6]|uniref:Multiphosphoryl transfer protein n=1 Tax=Methylobacterium mesophilicum SR1.6/6 TaxID=908290 RepID=A0A6B9FUJ1_9HYPH|nr:phosphoenolpyruvate--protein phosphotransferase [Methylobacterium mesophilicum]QGY04768.1 phosphoenolpyruvate--protein phosphotransferase [Methylobacterium mesophilicum SR1.6/6]